MSRSDNVAGNVATIADRSIANGTAEELHQQDPECANFAPLPRRDPYPT